MTLERTNKKTTLKERLRKYLRDGGEDLESFMFEVSKLKADLEAKIEDYSNILKATLHNAYTSLDAYIEDNSNNLKTILQDVCVSLKANLEGQLGLKPSKKHRGDTCGFDQ